MGLLVTALYKMRSLRPIIQFRNLQVPVSGAHVSRTVWKHLWKGGYERPEIEAVLALLRPNDRILELGSGIGIVSGVAGKSDPSVTIETYEANPALLPAIEELHRLNELSNIHPKNAVLLPDAVEGDTISFNLHENFTESSIQPVESNHSTEVCVQNFQNIFDSFSPDIMICDIEGGEAQLFMDFYLKGLRALVIELHPNLISRRDIKQVYEVCREANMYPRIDLSERQVEVFERVD